MYNPPFFTTSTKEYTLWFPTSKLVQWFSSTLSWGPGRLVQHLPTSSWNTLIYILHHSFKLLRKLVQSSEDLIQTYFIKFILLLFFGNNTSRSDVTLDTFFIYPFSIFKLLFTYRIICSLITRHGVIRQLLLSVLLIHFNDFTNTIYV